MARTKNNGSINPEREPKLLTQADVRKKNIRSGDTVLMWVYKHTIEDCPFSDVTIPPAIYKIEEVRVYCGEYGIMFEEMPGTGFSIASLLRHMKIENK